MSFLDRILPLVRAEIADPAYLASLPARGRPRPSLARAIASAPNRWAILIEHKRRSPGAREPQLPERPLAEFLRFGAPGRVEGLSCLATRAEFDGSPQDVRVLARATALPVLFKDFVIDPRQIEAADRAGASAVLLIARLETEGRLDQPLASLAEEAHRRGLEVLLEFHAPEELKLVETVPADVWGVNVRDLDALAFRPNVAEATVRALPHDRPVLGLSGVEGPVEARRWRAWGTEGVLVGSAFARAAEPDRFLAAIRAAGELPGGAR